MKITEVIKTNVTDVTKFLETAPKDELYTLTELSEKFGIARSTLRQSASLLKNRIIYLGKNFYGSKNALREFLKQIDKEDNEIN